MGRGHDVTTHPEVSLFQRNAARITAHPVLHALEKEAAISALPLLRRRAATEELRRGWDVAEQAAKADAAGVVSTLAESLRELEQAFQSVADVKVPDLLGKVEIELLHLRTARAHLEHASEALDRLDFGAAGAAVEECERELWLVGGSAVVPLNEVLTQAAVGKDVRNRLEENVAQRRQARVQLDHARRDGSRRDVYDAEARLRRLEAAGYRLAADILVNQVRPAPAGAAERVGRDTSMTVVPPRELETLADVGGLEEVKEHLRQSIGMILERPADAARYRVVYNGVLFYGPPGTGKNLLSRALAGEYGLRYLRFTPAAIASVYLHESATNLRRVFELAKQNVPCVLYLDEIDTIAGDRSDTPSADQREVVTQLMSCLEEYRTVPGLVIVAATNDLDRLDPALREGRFDAKIHVPLPDPADRKAILRVQLEHRDDAVDWEGLDLTDLAKQTHGYNSAALETVVSLAAQTALRAGVAISHEVLARVIAERGGQHRIALDDRITWDDVVLDHDVQTRIMDLLAVFSRPELARDLGVKAPAGIVLYGPPGTGKTTIARAMASQISASFYEMSAAELLSKWAGESEQKVAKLFAKARASRPSIIFIDEIDALLRRRNANSNANWEERVLSQFLRELDGLKGGEGVLLVGATNRLDTLDEAIVGRRLEPIEIDIPDLAGRLKLLKLLCRDVKIAKGVNLVALAEQTDGWSGSDLKRLRDTAGMRALGRASRGTAGKPASVTMADLQAALDARRAQISMAEA